MIMFVRVQVPSFWTMTCEISMGLVDMSQPLCDIATKKHGLQAISYSGMSKIRGHARSAADLDRHIVI